jgi:phenylacetate-CoA ligase
MIWRTVDKAVDSLSPQNLTRLYRLTPPWLVERVRSARFRQTVLWAARQSPFYREAFAKWKIDPHRVRHPADLGEFFTTPDDVAADPEKFICAPPSIVFESSGTSGKNKKIFYSRRELEQMGQIMAAGIMLMGVGPDERVANAFDFSMWIPGMLTHYALMSGGQFCMAFGKVDPLEVYRRLKAYRFNVVMGEPTWLIRLTEIAEREGSLPLKVLMGAAEEMPPNAIPWMEKVWQGAKVRMCYGSVEQGSAIGYQPCDQFEGYHVDDSDFYPEMMDVDSDGYGELVYTTLRRRVMPLIRYRSRDVTRLITEPCACGIPGMRMHRLRGRRDELVVASGGNLYPLMFESIFKPVRGLTGEWQIIFRLEGMREILEMNVETGRRDVETLEREIHHSCADLYPDLMKNLALGIFEMRLVVHPPGSIRKARKIKRMVDLRYAPPPESPATVPESSSEVENVI